MKLKSAVTLKDCTVLYTESATTLSLVAYGLGRSLLVLVGPRQLRLGSLVKVVSQLSH